MKGGRYAPAMAKKSRSPIDSAVAARLTEARKKAGYVTKSHFSDTIGVSQSVYSQHEAATRGMSMPSLQKYADALNITVDWLLRGGGAEPASEKRENTYPNMNSNEEKVISGILPPKVKPQKSKKDSLASSTATGTIEGNSTGNLFASDNPIPVFGPAKGVGDRIDLSKPVAHIPRTMQLVGIENVRAYIATHDTVTPFLKRGDTAVINPARPLEIGRPALLLDHESRIFIGVLTDITESTITIQPDPQAAPTTIDLGTLDGAFSMVMAIAR